MKPQKIPQRMCLGCGEMFPKRELIRIVRSPEGKISLDSVGRSPGRGAYICKKDDCLKKAQKNGRMARNLQVTVPPEIFAELEKEMKALEA